MSNVLHEAQVRGALVPDNIASFKAGCVPAVNCQPAGRILILPADRRVDVLLPENPVHVGRYERALPAREALASWLRGPIIGWAI